ncbi:MAG: hypothetical protein U0R19_07900 [Bryobacteraceae bacterium]
MMRQIGFSTGALARGDFRLALAILQRYNIRVVELSALRVEELEPLVDAIPDLDLSEFTFVSVHAPSRFPTQDEAWVLRQLQRLADRGYPVIVHPDVIVDPRRWCVLGSQLLLENMDKRKPVGRTVQELSNYFAAMPAARFCFDIGHARQVDPSMTEATLLLHAFGDRLAEVHVSEVNTASRHDPISFNAVSAFSPILACVPDDVPFILEPLIDRGQSDVQTEFQRATDIGRGVLA